MKNGKTLQLFAYASGIAAAQEGSAKGPLLLQQSDYFSRLKQDGVNYQWQATIQTQKKTATSKREVVADVCTQLAEKIAPTVQQKLPFAVFGGDHTCAIGTWSGVAFARRNQGPLGLIWIDAHMDSHTPQSSISGNIHGMPVASLLGYGDPSLTGILDNLPKIKPENLCLIGVRSFEDAEAELLKRLNVRVFFMSEVKQRGLDAVLQEAIEIVSQRTSGFGVSIDIDSIDPSDAPATGAVEPDGLRAKELCNALRMLANNPDLLGFEIVEFDPSHDIENKTEKLIPELVKAIILGS